MTTPSFELDQDHLDLRDWVHSFAADVVRPAAAEWDEREETPWPIIGEAAKIGLYGFESIAQFWADPSGLTFPLVNEELFWGDAGIGMAIFGTTLAVAGIFGSGTPEQLVEWVPQCFGDENDVKVGAFCASEPDAGSDVSGYRTTAKYDEGKDEWVINGQKAWATNGGIANVHVVIASVDRELGSRGHAAFVIPPGTKGLEQGAKVKKHGIRASHTADVHLGARHEGAGSFKFAVEPLHIALEVVGTLAVLRVFVVPAAAREVRRRGMLGARQCAIADAVAVHVLVAGKTPQPVQILLAQHLADVHHHVQLTGAVGHRLADDISNWLTRSRDLCVGCWEWADAGDIAKSPCRKAKADLIQ